MKRLKRAFAVWLFGRDMEYAQMLQAEKIACLRQRITSVEASAELSRATIDKLAWKLVNGDTRTAGEYFADQRNHA